MSNRLPQVIYIYTEQNEEQVSYIKELKELKKRVYFFPANYRKNYEAIINSPKFRLQHLPSLIIITPGEDGQDTISIIEGDRVKRWIINEQEIQYQKELNTEREKYVTKQIDTRPSGIDHPTGPPFVGPPSVESNVEPQLDCSGDTCEIKAPTNQPTQGPPSVGPPSVGPPSVGPPSVGPPSVGPVQDSSDSHDDGISSFLKRKGKLPESHLQVAPSTDGLVGKPTSNADLGELSGQAISDGSQPQRKMTQKQQNVRNMIKNAQQMAEERNSEMQKYPRF